MTAEKTHAGRKYVVMGGASGIGLAFAHLASQQGASVCVLDSNSNAIKKLQTDGIFAGSILCDVRQSDQLAVSVGQAASLLNNYIDGFVYTVGTDLEIGFDAMAEADWELVLDINLNGAMRAIKAALPYIRNASGNRCIINVSSAASLSPLVKRSAYCVSKAGLNMLTKCLAQELGTEGIRVATVAPGAVDTPLLRQSYENNPDPAADLAKIGDRYSLKRIAQPNEVAEAILYLCGAGASYITGTTLVVDGGRTFY